MTAENKATEIKDYKSAIFQALGEASMMWKPSPSSQVFDSDGAKEIGDRLVEELENNVPLAIKILKKAMNDEGYYIAWQANIAMACYDEIMSHDILSDEVSNKDVHEIANNAAKNFLNLLFERNGR